MSAIVEEARKWLGVKYLHQGRNRHGVDCAGFPRCVYLSLGATMPPDFRAYGLEAHPEALLDHLRAALGYEVAVAPVNFQSLHAGDIALFHFPKVKTPRHLAIIAPRDGGGWNFIESNGNQKRVIERRLDERYLARVTHVFRRPV